MIHCIADLQNWAIVVGIGAGLTYAIKGLPAKLEAKELEALNFLFTQGDAADIEWFKATIRWAEAKYGPGTGAQKADAVIAKIFELLPLRYRIFMSDAVKAKAKELFQKMFDSLEAGALSKLDQPKA